MGRIEHFTEDFSSLGICFSTFNLKKCVEKVRSVKTLVENYKENLYEIPTVIINLNEKSPILCN